jgi:hypothetical protein
MDRRRREAHAKYRSNEPSVRHRPGTEGAILSEYAVIIGVCGIVISFAILLTGTQLAHTYYQNRQIVIAPVP